MLKKTHKNLLACTLIGVTLSGCATSNRNPASEDEMNLSQIIEAIKYSSNLRKEVPGVCKTQFDRLYQRLYNLAGDSAYFDINNLPSIDRSIEEAFLSRIALKESIKDNDINDECLRSIADVFKGLRYLEDYLIDIRMEKTANTPAEYTNLKGEFPYLLVNPKFAAEFKSYEDLKSGDIILSRGNAFSSAAIARIGTNDYQFSHLSFVYRDAATKEAFTTEAHIEIGSVVEPLIEHITSKNAREVVFRYTQDTQIAHEASKYMHDKVLSAQLKKKNIEYDFSMNYKDDSRIFCTEIISTGFKKVLPNEDFVPRFKSKFSAGSIPFLNNIGVPATKENINELDTFAPGDIQFDPRFELVAEWRNPRKMEESRLKDFILTALFERMDKADYKFDPSFKMDAQAKILWLLRRLPVVKKFVQNKYPLNMTPTQMELFMALDKVGDTIYKTVEKASLEYDRPMTPKEIYSSVDEFFKQDFELYKRYKKGQEVMKPAFHSLFHP